MIYSYVNLLHYLAVVLFLGNIFTGFFWMQIAMKTKDLAIISHSVKGVIKSDAYFTIPAAVVIAATGFISAIYNNIPILSTGWVFWSILFFSISGIIFSLRVGPLQKRIYTLTSRQYQKSDFNWKGFRKLYVEWKIWGLIAFFTPIIVLIMMILKIPH